MDLNQLSLFFEVAKAKNFSTASDILGVERSTVSRSIAALERSLGTQLFSRTTRQVALTSAGVALYKEITPHMLALDNAVATASEKGEAPKGLLRLSAPNDMSITFLPEVLAGFHARYPAVRIDVRVENRRTDVVQESVDVALRVVHSGLPDSTLIGFKLSELVFHAYASPGYLLRHGQPEDAEAASRLQWLTFRGSFLAGFPAPAQTPAIVADDMLFHHRAALAGMGVAALPTFLAKPDVLAGRLLPVLPEQLQDRAELHLLHPPAKRLPLRVRAFRDYLVQYLDTHPLY
jgi:DNA-binding transcriptional LysR family regulator